VRIVCFLLNQIQEAQSSDHQVITENAGQLLIPFDRQPHNLATSGEVRLAVFDVSGRRVATLQEGRQEAGRHAVTWNGTDDAGRGVSSGIYFARLETADGVVDTNKLTLLK